MSVKAYDKLYGMAGGGGTQQDLAALWAGTKAGQSSKPWAMNSGPDGAATSIITDTSDSAGLQTSGGSSSSWQAQPVMPPVLDILAEMRARRDSEAQRAKLISDILGANTPRGQKNYLGFEPGGVADVLMGIITGKGPSAGADILPADQRAVRRTEVPIPGAEPSVGDEAGGAMSLAEMIMNLIRVISTGGSQSQQSSAGSLGGLDLSSLLSGLG